MSGSNGIAIEMLFFLVDYHVLIPFFSDVSTAELIWVVVWTT